MEERQERTNKRGLFTLNSRRQSEKVYAHASSAESLAGVGAMNFKLDSSLDALPSKPEGPFRRCLNRFSPQSIGNKFGINSRDANDDGRRGLGTMSGVLIPTCENMWGVLIFLRFFYIVGNAGVWQSFIIVIVSFLCAILTTMSLSAIATNGPIEEGGTYYLISRALGPKIGGSVGCMYFLGVALLAVLETLGAVEMLLFTFPSLEFTSSDRVMAVVILSFLGFMVFFGIRFVSKLSMVFFAIVLYTMGSYYLGLFLAPRGDAPRAMTGLSWTTFKGNWNSGYKSGVSFPVVLSVFFPCFTGILSGADRAKNLRKPEKSIPAGTIGAVVISLLLYLSYMGLWAAVGTRDYLLGSNSSGKKSSDNLSVVTDVGFPLAILTQLGIIIASISQALQCLITSPRLLQAIAGDGVIPFLSRLSKTSKNGEPRAALLVTSLLTVLAAMIGSLDAVAPLVSICFLTCYSALNLSCVVLSVLKAPSWRPKWRYYHWFFALIGFILCFAMNFVIKWYWAIVAVVVLILIYVYIDYRQVEVDWGTGLGGLRLQLAVQSIMTVGHEARYSVNWRPQLLCLCKPRAARGIDNHDNYEFLSFVSHLKKGRGLCVVAAILEGKLDEKAPQAEAERVELENSLQAAGVNAFARVLVAQSYKEGKTYAIQSSGLGGLEPNTLVMGWPSNWNKDGHSDSAEVMLDILTECKAVNKAVLLCMHLDEFPTAGAQQEGVIDVWWIVHDGGLLLILAHLLKLHKIWRKCKLRVHTVAEQLHDSYVVKKNLVKLLEQVRIEAEVQVLELDDTGLAPYTFDYTIRLEEARAFAEEVAHYRMFQERKDHQRNLEQSKQEGSLKVAREVQAPGPSLSLPKNIQDDILSGSNSMQRAPNQARSGPPNALANPHKADLKEGAAQGIHKEDGNEPSSKLDSERSTSIRPTPELKKLNMEPGESLTLPKVLEQSSTPRMSKSSSRSGEDILKKSVPGELSLLEGALRPPRIRSGPLNSQLWKSELEEGRHVDSHGSPKAMENQKTDLGKQELVSAPAEHKRLHLVKQEHDSSPKAVEKTSITKAMENRKVELGRQESGGFPMEHKRMQLVRQELDGSFKAVDPINNPSMSKSSSRSADSVMKNVIPAEVGMLEGSPRPPRVRSGPLNIHALPVEDAYVKENTQSGKTTGGRNKEYAGRVIRNDFRTRLEDTTTDNAEHYASVAGTSCNIDKETNSRFQDDRKIDADCMGVRSARQSVDNSCDAEGLSETGNVSCSLATSSPVAGEFAIDMHEPFLESTQLTQDKNKETRWADQLKDDALEIKVEGTTEDPLLDERSLSEEEQAAARGMVRLNSAGQLYPGSPHHAEMGIAQELPDAMKRTWETFSQSYSPKRLNEIIYEQSKDAQLVLLNLPDHYRGMQPTNYMEYCEELTAGLRRVLLVHGTGKELWNVV